MPVDSVPASEVGFPTGDELASIIILCCNQLQYSRVCLESVLRHTRSPYELVLVDNGSRDGTLAYLDYIRMQTGPARVEIIRNETNRGFPAGCNQALARAHGNYLVFLNNDTILTGEWLEGLISWALHEWPSVGLVGAVSNYAAPPQQIPVSYADFSGMDVFARHRRHEYAGKGLNVERLIGFCLLVRREVLERVGKFDEQYGLGFFDDDDLCVRAREAGFRLVVALNVFAHHFGSRTFADLGIDCMQQLKSNFALFQAKWGPVRSAGYCLPDSKVPSPGFAEKSAGHSDLEQNRPAAQSGARLTTLSKDPSLRTKDRGLRTVSLCMIVKNEQANLPACLGLVADLMDEIIVVDTGSTDATKEVARQFRAHVFDFEWIDSFAAARNESLRHATGQWIFWLDADDRLDADNRRKLRALFAGLKNENVAYSMKCLCLPDPVSGAAVVVDHVRLFRNHPQVRWEYRVHEQILGSI